MISRQTTSHPRRAFLRGAGVAFAAALLSPLAPLQAAPEKPNFVLIFADDLGYGDLPVYNPESKIRTPNFDRMAQEGTRFTDFYVSAPVCSASRAALLTGRYHKRTGVFGALFPTAKNGLPDKEITIAEVLKEQGYATTCIGKWHLGHLPQFLPMKQGFDSYYGIPYSNDMTPPVLMRGEEIIENPVEQSTLTRRYTEEAVKFIKTNKEKPFFLYLPHTMPHVPLAASEQFKGKSAAGFYGDVIEELDWSVGEVLTALRANGLDEKTLVIFTSDNGPWLIKKDHGGSAGPLRDGKGTQFEGGMREPFFARWPGRIPAGAVNREVATTMDILPTFAALSGGKVPTDRIIDGRDISPLLFNTPGAKSPHEAFFYFQHPTLRAVRSGPWKLWLKNQKDPAELYNLHDDIGEKTDVSAQHPDEVKRLIALVNGMDAELRGGAQITGAKDKAVPLDTLKIGDALTAAAAPDVAQKAFTVSCEIEAQNLDGVIVSHGGNRVGYALHLQNGKPVFSVRINGNVTSATAQNAIAGKTRLEAKLDKNGAIWLYVNGQQAATAKAPGLLPNQPAEDFCVGHDARMPVGDYIAPGTFRGTIDKLSVLALP